MKRLSDFATSEDLVLEGDKKTVEEILDQEIVVKKFRVSKSKFEGRTGDYLTLQFTFLDSNDLMILFTGSKVIIDQIQRYSSELPFITKIVQINRYYSLT